MLTDRRKIMIMTASVGCGHDQAAKVVKEYLLDKYNNLDIEIIDFMDILPLSIGSLIKATYLKVIDVVPGWYNILYQGTMKLNQKSKVTNILAHQTKKKLLSLIEDFNPDIILFTNPLPLTLVSYLKRKNKIHTYTAGIITDYTAHSVWLDSTVDSYFVGSNILKDELIDRGIEASKIHVTGIPIDSKFAISVNREEKMLNLGLNSSVPTILIMGGGLGLGSMEEILETTDQINKELQLIVVVGKNQTLKAELENRVYNSRHKVKILGFCDNINELMEFSDLLISKAGGLTMTEAVTKMLPVLVFDPIPGQEVKNAQYFSDIGAAMYLKDLNDIKEAIEDLLYTNPKKRYKMIKCCSVIRKPDATKDVAQFMLSQLYAVKLDNTPMIK